MMVCVLSTVRLILFIIEKLTNYYYTNNNNNVTTTTIHNLMHSSNICRGSWINEGMPISFVCCIRHNKQFHQANNNGSLATNNQQQKQETSSFLRKSNQGLTMTTINTNHLSSVDYDWRMIQCRGEDEMMWLITVE